MYFNSLTDFLEKFGVGFETHRVLSKARIANPDISQIPGLNDLLKQPLGAQGISILGGFTSLNDFGFHLINARTGCGKTFMGIASVFAHWTAQGRPRGTRWIVVIPPNGVKDWIKEILETIPPSLVRVVKVGHFGAGPKRPRTRRTAAIDDSGLKAVRLDDFGEITRAEGDEKVRFTLQDLRGGCSGYPTFLDDEKLTFFVVTRERVKRQPTWRPATLKVRRLLDGKLLDAARETVDNDPIREKELQALRAAGSRTDYLKRRLEGLFKWVDTDPSSGKEVAVRKTKRTFNGKSALWQYDRRGGDVWPVATFISRYLRGFFDGVLVDEVHEFNGDSEQGAAVSRLIGGGLKFVGLSATLSNGTVESFRGLLNRLAPEKMNAMGYGPAESGGLHRMVRAFGIEEKITTTIRMPNGKEERKHRWREGGGILPHFQTAGFTTAGPFTNFTSFIDLEDVVTPQPINYETILFDVEGDLLNGFDDLYRQFLDHYVKSRFGHSHLQNWALSTLANYLDNPRGWGAIGSEVQVFPKNLAENLPSRKEQKLVEIVRSEIAQGRRTMIYVDYTSFGVAERIQRILEKNGISCSYLTAAIDPANRSDWLKAVVDAGQMVVLTNAELAKTGNLIDFNTAVFYQSSNPRVITRIQAGGRYQRVTTTKPVRIIYLAWRGTVQEAILERTGRKMLAIDLSQGRFVEAALETWGEGTADLFRQVMASPETISSGAVWEELRSRNQPPNPEIGPIVAQDLQPVCSVSMGKKRKRIWWRHDQLTLFDPFSN